MSKLPKRPPTGWPAFTTQDLDEIQELIGGDAPNLASMRFVELLAEYFDPTSIVLVLRFAKESGVMK